MSNEEIENVANFVAAPSDRDSGVYTVLAANADSVSVVDDMIVDWVVKTGSFKTNLDVAMRPTVFAFALNSLPEAVKNKCLAYVKSAQKMKQPKINDQMDDAVDVDDLEDEADKDDMMLARPAHLFMEVDDKRVEGASDPRGIGSAEVR